MKIETIENLKEYFHQSKSPEEDSVFVNGSIRKEWMLNGERTIIEGRVYDIEWADMKGGVWKARLCKPSKINFKK